MAFPKKLNENVLINDICDIWGLGAADSFLEKQYLRNKISCLV